MKQTDGKADGKIRIYPVILAVPEEDRQLSGREKVGVLSRMARQALAISAAKNNIRLGELSKTDAGVPLPFQGNYWSLTHKMKYVAAVISSYETGIDIEEIKPVTDAMFRKIASEYEWRMVSDDPNESFFRYWTAKEAVLKAVGVGMAGLSKCTVEQVMDRHHLQIMYADRAFCIEHNYFDGHIASVVQNNCRIRWIILDADTIL